MLSLALHGNFQLSKSKENFMNVFFITGTSGSGKTTLTHYLKSKLSKDLFTVYDFDENGVPSNPDKNWRQETTDYWLIKAQENGTKHKSTVICGVTVPSEVLNSPKKPNLSLSFGFIKISDEIIKQRLKARGWNDQLIQDNCNWAHYLEAEVQKASNHIIVDSSLYASSEQIGDEFIQWIYSTLNL